MNCPYVFLCLLTIGLKTLFLAIEKVFQAFQMCRIKLYSSHRRAMFLYVSQVRAICIHWNTLKSLARATGN